MIRYLIISLLFLIQIPMSLGQNVELEWVSQLGGDQMDVANKICLDNEGNIIVAGYYDGRIDVDPSDEYHYLEHVDESDAYITKLNPSGELIWGIGLCGEGHDIITDIQVDQLGYIYVAGYFYGNIDVDPSNETLIFNSKGESDIFICKYDPNGHLVWAKEIGNEKYNFCEAFIMDNDGNLFISANFKLTLDCDPNQGVHNIESYNDRYDFFLLKLNNEGQFVWVQHFEGESYEKAYGIAIDDNANIYLSGYYYGTIDLDPSEDTAIYHSNGGEDLFICKLNGDGELIWANSMGDEDDDKALKLVLDPFNNFYIAGYYYHSMDFDPGTNTWVLNGYYASGYIAKYSEEGELIWARNVSNPQSSFISDLEIDSQGNIFTTGYFYNDCDFDPSGENYIIPNPYDTYDIFVLNLNEDGQLLWANAFSGVDHSGQGLDIEIDDDGNIFTVGGFKHTFDFDPSEEVDNLIANGIWDGYVHKMKTCREEYNVSYTACNGSFESPSGLFVWDTPGYYVDTISEPFSCEAIYHINLEFDNLDNTVENQFNTLVASEMDAIYQWIDCRHGPIQGAVERTYIPNYEGDYAVIVSKGDCVDTSACMTVQQLEFKFYDASMIAVYPNPSTGSLNMDLGREFDAVSITILNSLGQECVIKNFETTSNISFEIKDKGLHYLRIELDQLIVYNKKILIL